MRWTFSILLLLALTFTGSAEEKATPTTETTAEIDLCKFEVMSANNADATQFQTDLLSKLARFDECLGVQNVNNNAGTGFAKDAGKQATAQNANPAESTASQSTDSSEDGQDAEQESQDEQTSEEESREESGRNRQDNRDLLSERQLNTELRSGSQEDRIKQIRNEKVEDNVAKLLREAAENETNPERKKSLYKSYEDYMTTRRK